MEKPFLAQWLYERQAMGWVDVSCGLSPADPVLHERPTLGAQGAVMTKLHLSQQEEDWGVAREAEARLP